MWVVRLELASVRLVEVNKRKEMRMKKVRQRSRFFLVFSLLTFFSV